MYWGEKCINSTQSSPTNKVERKGTGEWLALHKGYQFFEKDSKIKILTAREPVLPSFEISKTAYTAIQSIAQVII